MEGACSIMADQSTIDATAVLLRQFLNGRVPCAEAVAQLESIGYSLSEAMAMVDEWTSVEEDEATACRLENWRAGDANNS